MWWKVKHWLILKHREKRPLLHLFYYVCFGICICACALWWGLGSHTGKKRPKLCVKLSYQSIIILFPGHFLLAKLFFVLYFEITLFYDWIFQVLNVLVLITTDHYFNFSFYTLWTKIVFILRHQIYTRGSKITHSSKCNLKLNDLILS